MVRRLLTHIDAVKARTPLPRCLPCPTFTPFLQIHTPPPKPDHGRHLRPAVWWLPLRPLLLPLALLLLLLQPPTTNARPINYFDVASTRSICTDGIK